MAGSFGVWVSTAPFKMQLSLMVQFSEKEMLWAPFIAARREIRLPVSVSIQLFMYVLDRGVQDCLDAWISGKYRE